MLVHLKKKELNESKGNPSGARRHRALHDMPKHIPCEWVKRLAHNILGSDAITGSG